MIPVSILCPQPNLHGLRDRVCHPDDEMQSRVLQYEVFHESAYVDYPHDVCMTDGGQPLVYPTAGKKGTFPYADVADVLRFTEAGVDGDETCVRVGAFYVF